MLQSLNNVEDFLVDESFRKWVNSPTPELEILWSQYLLKNPEKKGVFLQAKTMASQISFNNFEADLADSERVLTQIKSQTPNWNKESKHIVWPYWSRVAAILIFSVALGILSYWFTTQNPAKQSPVAMEWILKENPNGVKSKHTLPDGTVVNLNAGSSIKYPQLFDNSNRKVTLIGEAFFDVVSDSLRPFNVHAEDFIVTVLGTKFNMVADEEDKFVALVEGRVQVATVLSNIKTLLKPGQKADLIDQKAGFEVKPFNQESTIGWISGKLVFQDASFAEVTNKLEKWYGKSITINNQPAANDWSYTAVFNNKSLDNVLLNMSSVRDFEYEISNEKVEITF